MSCFGRKKKVDKGPTYDFTVPTPEIPEEPSQFVVVGPVGAGKRTLASAFAHLTLPFFWSVLIHQYAGEFAFVSSTQQ